VDDDSGNHHVAWKDRIGLNKAWMLDVLACSESFGTEGYSNAVKRYRNDLVNIKGGPNLRSIVDEYVKGPLDRWKDAEYRRWVQINPNDSLIPEICKRVEYEIDDHAMERLHTFINQLMEDNGFGFYRSEIPEDEVSLSDLD
jgi:hypothetical protein